VNQDLKFNDREKIESVKAGTIAALSLLIVFAIATLGNHWILAQHSPSLLHLPPLQQLLASAAGVAASGFLFGITYRYTIRDDRNPHLKSGAVLAFGLVRAIPQIEPGISQMIGSLPQAKDVWPLAILGLESLILFASARIVLDWAIARKWVKPFI
jgi:cellobiose-specific phosphotransferase system component IIC